MIRTFTLSATPLAPIDPKAKLPIGPTDLRDPVGAQFVAEWLAHVEAGRIGWSLGQPAAALLEEPLPSAAGLPEESLPPTAMLLEAEARAQEVRAIVLANQRLICGDGRLPVW